MWKIGLGEVVLILSPPSPPPSPPPAFFYCLTYFITFITIYVYSLVKNVVIIMQVEMVEMVVFL